MNKPKLLYDFFRYFQKNAIDEFPQSIEELVNHFLSAYFFKVEDRRFYKNGNLENIINLLKNFFLYFRTHGEKYIDKPVKLMINDFLGGQNQ